MTPPLPSPCPVCARGCGCTPADACCGHYGCYGSGPRNCPGAVAEEARYTAAVRAKRQADARTLARRARLAATYRAAVASTFRVGRTR